MKHQVIISSFLFYLYMKAVCVTTLGPLITNNSVNPNNVTYTDVNLAKKDDHRESRNLLAPSYFCGQIIGGHYMFGSTSTYCGGYSVVDCSALCFYRNFTLFQCEGFVCHCYSTNST